MNLKKFWVKTLLLDTIVVCALLGMRMGFFSVVTFKMKTKWNFQCPSCLN